MSFQGILTLHVLFRRQFEPDPHCTLDYFSANWHKRGYLWVHLQNGSHKIWVSDWANANRQWPSGTTCLKTSSHGSVPSNYPQYAPKSSFWFGNCTIGHSPGNSSMKRPLFLTLSLFRRRPGQRASWRICLSFLSRWCHSSLRPT